MVWCVVWVWVWVWCGLLGQLRLDWCRRGLACGGGAVGLRLGGLGDSDSESPESARPSRARRPMYNTTPLPPPPTTTNAS